MAGIWGRMGKGACRGKGGGGTGATEDGDQLVEGGLILRFAATSVDILCATPAKGDAVDPLNACDPERINGQMMHIVSQAQFVLDIGGFARFFGGDEDDSVRFTDGVAQSGFPVRCSWL